MITRQIQAAVLDMDGLMFDTESIYQRAWQAAASECGYSLTDDQYLTLIGVPMPACEAALFQWFGETFPMDSFRKRWKQRWKAEMDCTGAPAKPGLSALLDFFKERQLPMAVATSSDQDYTAFTLEKARLTGQFQIVVTGDEVPNGKPAPDIYLESARRLDVSPQNCLALEDSDAGVLAARSAGMTTVMVPDIKAPSPQAEAAAYCVVSSLLEAKNRIAPLFGT